MIRRLLLVTAVAGTAFGSFAPAQAAEPNCTGAFAAGYTVGYCAGFVCTDLCYWESYPVCEQPDDSPVDLCATVNAMPSIR